MPNFTTAIHTPHESYSHRNVCRRCLSGGLKFVGYAVDKKGENAWDYCECVRCGAPYFHPRSYADFDHEHPLQMNHILMTQFAREKGW
jgi:hypothetical protein